MIDVDVKGVRIPALGFGTWQLEGKACKQAVMHALSVGYRRVDTAASYDNETDVGAAVRASGVAREDVFVTTKLLLGSLTRDQVHRSMRESLRRLGLDYVDLLLIHWPDPDVPLTETLHAMMELADEGLAMNLGVSNFPPRHFIEALELAPIVCNQVEYHPFLDQRKLLVIAQAGQVMLDAYCPLARGKVRDDATLRQIGDGHGKTPAQVALRWLLQQPYVGAIPKASTREHIAENFDIFDFMLSDEEMAAIGALDRQERLVDPMWAPDWDARPDIEDELRVIGARESPGPAETVSQSFGHTYNPG